MEKFRFKRFDISHRQCAMKVGTDGVLLGAYVSVGGVKRALDIGSGCGLIALMLAQRGVETCVGVEIDAIAAIEAQENVKNSPWNAQITLFCRDFCDENFVPELGNFDLIVSNPPFFSTALKSPNEKKNTARHNEALPFATLTKNARTALSPNGRFCVILPVSETSKFQQTAKNQGLFLSELCYVFAKPQKIPVRNILTFKQETVASVVESTLCIRNADETYSDDYKNITRDFYLGF